MVFNPIKFNDALPYDGILRKVAQVLGKRNNFANQNYNFGAYLGEFCVTFGLAFLICINVIHGQTDTALKVGLYCAAMIYSMGIITGSNFNPGLSLAMWLARPDLHTFMSVFSYWCSQMLGAFCGALVAWGITGETIGIAPGTRPDGTVYGAGEAFLIEVIMTAFFHWVVLHVAFGHTDFPNDYFGLAIGFQIYVSVGTMVPVSGACLNPALAVAFITTNVMNKGADGGGEWFPVYFFAGFVAALLSSTIFKLNRAKEFDDQYAKTYHKADSAINGAISKEISSADMLPK
ncbi:unnamed protein product [Vitrella brassicaformis CCMP3155]|uniref:Aquaporin n=1 Tax=Vitrella brassicaformis (strain CCMP3155) TaxID=1169540 RepID=A0A0G4FQB7_VITBC|nr:unnamed protein product [Vitrella brassicaformis CCMP3155]|eukprot:CEM16031.1 unnamed protein product [Vitrella brassicaformis CCMP3155]